MNQPTVIEPTEAELSLLHSVIIVPIIPNGFDRSDIIRNLNQRLPNHDYYDMYKLCDISITVLYNNCPRIYTDEKIQGFINDNDIFKIKIPSTNLVSPYITQVIEDLNIETLRQILHEKDVYGLYKYLKQFKNEEEIDLFRLKLFMSKIYSSYAAYSGYTYDISLTATKDIYSRILIRSVTYNPRIYPFNYVEERIRPYIYCFKIIALLDHSNNMDKTLREILYPHVPEKYRQQTFDLVLKYIKESGINELKNIKVDNPLHDTCRKYIWSTLSYRTTRKIALDIYNEILPMSDDELYEFIMTQDYPEYLDKLQEKLKNLTELNDQTEEVKELKTKIEKISLIRQLRKLPREIVKDKLFTMLFKKQPVSSPDFIVCYISYIVSDVHHTGKHIYERLTQELNN